MHDRTYLRFVKYKTVIMKGITKISLGENGPLVSKLGLGCINTSLIWGNPGNYETESIATI
jgi:hypothetical protein